MRKLEYFREGGSEKHVRDIRAMLEVSAETVDRAFIEAWVQRLHLADTWARVLAVP